MTTDIAITAPASRITIIFHPNMECVDVVLNDRKFNNELYAFSREKEPEGKEATLIYTLSDIIGIDKAETVKNKLMLVIAPCMRPNEYIPHVIRAIISWAGEGYMPSIEVDERREAVPATYDEFGHMVSRGVRMETGDIGVTYIPFR